ncbi:MAG: hypothetical protein GTO18_13640 [Anaerolineales bacterium]|nr:hypothetical protein [Anaerolineales bacterium]
MNRIRPSRLLLAGLATILAFIIIEFVWEILISTVLLNDSLGSIRGVAGVSEWTLRDQAFNIAIALFNCFMLIWLYASLRPMFGVGPKTALIASGFAFAFVFAFQLNHANLGFIPYRLALIDSIDLIIELPLSLIAGAQVYESGRWGVSNV